MEVIDKKLNEDLSKLDFYGEDETMQVAIKDKFKDDFDLTEQTFYFDGWKK